MQKKIKKNPFNKYKTKPPKKHRIEDRKNAEPFFLSEDDPTNFWGDDAPKVKPDRVKPLRRNSSKQRKPKKVLTNLKRFASIVSISKAKKKGDKMATDKKTQNKSSKTGVLVSILWLGLAAQQAFAGYVLLANFSNYFVVATALISLGIAGVVVVKHFVDAHK